MLSSRNNIQQILNAARLRKIERVEVKKAILLAASQGLAKTAWEHGNHDVINGFEYALSDYITSVEQAIKQPKAD